jgi:hypothetical protein
MENKRKRVRKHRPNIAKLKKQAELRGHSTPNETVLLQGTKVKNILNRVFVRAFDDDFNKTECNNIRKYMEEFETKINELIHKKSL